MSTKHYENLKGYKSYGVINGFPFTINSREKTPKGCKGEQLILHAKHHLYLIYMLTKYNQNISNGIKAME